MYTQNTPVHVRLWHRDFWLMALANLLITAAVYIQIPLLPLWLLGDACLTHTDVAWAMGAHSIGVFALGCFCSYLVQRYRRNRVCVVAFLAVALFICSFCYVQKGMIVASCLCVAVTVMRFLQGAALGLAQMVLSSTLIIDTCESFQRTEANYSSTWISRFALALGPTVSLALIPYCGTYDVLVLSVALCLLAALFVLLVKFPFRTPEETVRIVSLDRFFLPQGKWLFVNLMVVTTVVGMVLTAAGTLAFYGMLTVGFFLSLLAQRFVFVNAELKSEVISGLILMAVAVLLQFSVSANAAKYMSPVLFGCGIGVIGSRFLLFFLKLRGHCQRGTSQSTYFLAWESGLSLGLFVGYYFFYGDATLLNSSALILIAVALIMYAVFTHSWYIRNKNR